MEATPRPWVARANDDVDDEGVCSWEIFHAPVPNMWERHSIYRVDRGDFHALDQANAELIVRSVNAYDGLVAALEAAYQHMTGAENSRCICGIPWDVDTQVRAALAAARGEGVEA